MSSRIYVSIIKCMWYKNSAFCLRLEFCGYISIFGFEISVV